MIPERNFPVSDHKSKVMNCIVAKYGFWRFHFAFGRVSS